MARSHGVTRKTVAAWQARGLVVLSYDGRIDVDASDARLAEQAEADYGDRVRRLAGGAARHHIDLSRALLVPTADVPAAGRERAPLARRPGCTGDRERVTLPSMAKAHYPITPMTLGNMRSLGVHSLAVTCELCHHEAILGADDWSDAVLVRAFRLRMVCTRCGIIGADSRPNWREMKAQGK